MARPIVIGTLGKDQIEEFRKQCGSIGWIITSVTDNELVYLDRKMNRHTLTLGKETDLLIV